MNHKTSNKGFYIALCSCIAIIGAIAYIGNSASEPVKQKASDNIKISDSKPTPYTTVQTPIPTKAPTPSPTVNTAKKTSESSGSTTAKPIAKSVSKPVVINDNPPSPSAAEMKFIMPVTGKIIGTFSDGGLLYNKDMDDWRSHDGIDIASDIGTDVKAVYDGKVTSIEDTSLGKTVKIEHINGYTSIYSNLDDSISLKPDRNIKSGDIVGKVGKTSVCEQFMDSHLHFELTKDGEYVNPLEFVKQ